MKKSTVHLFYAVIMALGVLYAGYKIYYLYSLNDNQKLNSLIITFIFGLLLLLYSIMRFTDYAKEKKLEMAAKRK